jgi:hypothetical protein
MFLHQGIFPVKRDGVKVQIERDAQLKAKSGHGVKPQAHQVGIAVDYNANLRIF